MAKRQKQRIIKVRVKCKGTARDCKLLKQHLKDEADRINDTLRRGLAFEES